MMRGMALTVTTDQIQGWGLVGCIIIILGAALVVRLVRSLVGRLAWTLIALLLLALVWFQRTQVIDSVKRCDPQVLGVHLKISDPTARARCVRTLEGSD